MAPMAISPPKLWPSLPLELKQMIIKLVLTGKGPFAVLATISRDWQQMVEQHTFAKITLTASRLQDFDFMTLRNRHHVKHIWLNVELEEYSCPECMPSYNDDDDEFDEVADEVAVSCNNSRLLDRVFSMLFNGLSSWDASCNVVLDVSVHSPTDKRHGFSYLSCEPDWTGDDNAWFCRYGRLLSKITLGDFLSARPPKPCETGVPSYANLQKVFDDVDEWAAPNGLEEHQWWRRLPEVPAVTGLMLRQQSRRRWNPEVLTHLVSLCPRLKEIHYEPWREWTEDVQLWADTSREVFFESLPTKTLRHLVIFENFNDIYARAEGCDPIRILNANVSMAIAKASLLLETFSASFMTDASDFFSAADSSSWHWPNLTSFSITSTLLSNSKYPAEIDRMLASAARAAKRMPKLQTLEIWGVKRNKGMVFRYIRSQHQDGEASIVCRGTWALRLSARVKTPWTQVAHKQDQKDVTFSTEVVDPALMASHASAILTLKLVNQVIRPISRQQIHLETTKRARMLRRAIWEANGFESDSN